jgi:hypothetical protein
MYQTKVGNRKEGNGAVVRSDQVPNLDRVDLSSQDGTMASYVARGGLFEP